MIQPDFQNQTWIENGGPQMYCYENPHAKICDKVPALYQYDIWLGPNAFFLAFFLASMVAFAATWIVTRRALAFNIALILGLICEVIGYGGRIINYNNKWDNTGFYMQICCLTIGPAFMAAGVYLCLRRIVTAFGPENSRIPPEYYTRIFIPCDVISLVLQALGGALASLSLGSSNSADTGTNIMIAGLAFQVVTILAFITAAADFALRTHRRQRDLGIAALTQQPALVAMRNARRFKVFLAALAAASVLILWRSSFRVAELCDGWDGPVIGNQPLFVAFEGVLIALAVLVLNVCHPAVCAAPLFETGGGGFKGMWLCGRRKEKASSEKSMTDLDGRPNTSY